jgi:hypothetical protein
MRKAGADVVGGKILPNRLNGASTFPQSLGKLNGLTKLPGVLDRKMGSVGKPGQIPGIDVAVPDHDAQCNAVHPYHVRIRQIDVDIPSPTNGEIGIQRRRDPFNYHTIRMEDMAMYQDNPQTVVNPAQWNWHATMEQRNLFLENREKYMKLTPREYFLANFFVAGIVQYQGGQYGFKTSGNGDTFTVLNQKGDTETQPYWSDIHAGSKCYLVVKRMPGQSKFYLNALGNRANHGTGMREVDLPPGKKFYPIQIAAFTLANDAVLPAKLTQYVDEDGNTHYDGLVIYMGQVLATPLGRLTYDHSTSQPEHLVPIVHGAEQASTQDYTPTRLVLDINDGCMPLPI